LEANSVVDVDVMDPAPSAPALPAAESVVGVDIGGTGVKAGVVDLAKGCLIGDRVRLDTPHPATPGAIAGTVAQLIHDLGHTGRVGLTVPAVVQRGVVRTAANIDPSWIGTDADTLFGERLGVECHVLNDADAAGLAEVRYGAGRGHPGVVIALTLGTGIGSAVFTDGVLVPNTELGHLEFHGGDAEHYAAASVRERDDMPWKKWGHHVGHYLAHLEELFSPELFIIGGGVSKKPERFFPYLGVDTPVVAAALANQAGIVGAAEASGPPLSQPATVGTLP
jgi:polyphosphate glucokinase